MGDKFDTEDFTCTICKKIVLYYCDIHYSQGEKVCEDCKKNNEQSDKKAFDRDMSFR